MAKHGLLVLLAAGTIVLLCSPQLADAACCMTGQPTYKGSELRFEGIPTCSDGPCSGSGFDYTKKGAFESPIKEACCDKENSHGFFVNPKAGRGKWPGIKGFPQSFDGTALDCDVNVPVFRCRLGGQEKANPKRFSFKRFI